MLLAEERKDIQIIAHLPGEDLQVQGGAEEEPQAEEDLQVQQVAHLQVQQLEDLQVLITCCNVAASLPIHYPDRSFDMGSIFHLFQVKIAGQTHLK